MVILWLYSGYTMVILWLYYGYSMVLLWLYNNHLDMDLPDPKQPLEFPWQRIEGLREGVVEGRQSIGPPRLGAIEMTPVTLG